MIDETLMTIERMILTDMADGTLMSIGGRVFENHVFQYDAGNDLFISLKEAKYIRVNADGMYAITDAGLAAIGRER